MTAPAPESGALGSILGDLHIPGANELGSLKTDIDDFIDAINTVDDYANKYGSFIPGASAILGPLNLLNKALQVAKTLLNYV